MSWGQAVDRNYLSDLSRVYVPSDCIAEQGVPVKMCGSLSCQVIWQVICEPMLVEIKSQGSDTTYFETKPDLKLRVFSMHSSPSRQYLAVCLLV